jgi:formate--tetrahydrofolate ligase
VVAVCGEIMLMPGLPAEPAAQSIDIDQDGNITGLF